jgi:uncharacterized protein (DUF1499 family)
MMKTINLPEIIKRYNLNYIDLLKVDIEGSENFLLKVPNLEIVLNKVGLLYIELHGDDNIKAFNDNVEIKSYFDRYLMSERESRVINLVDDSVSKTQVVKLTKKPMLNILKSIN